MKETVNHKDEKAPKIGMSILQTLAVVGLSCSGYALIVEHEDGATKVMGTLLLLSSIGIGLLKVR